MHLKTCVCSGNLIQVFTQTSLPTQALLPTYTRTYLRVLQNYSKNFIKFRAVGRCIQSDPCRYQKAR